MQRFVQYASYGELWHHQADLYREYGVTVDQHRRLVQEFGAHDYLGISEAVIDRIRPDGMGWSYTEPDGLNYRQ